MAYDNDDGYSVMQAQLGLMGASRAMSPLGIPTPMPPMMPVRHPGEVARDMVQQTQTAAMQTMQSSAMINQGSGWGLGNFARQYQQNMAGIQAQQLNPWAAGAMGSMMGMGGYQPGMMPSPVQMTAPSMGIYRPPPPMPMSTIPPVPPMPIFPSPFQAHPTSPMFSTPFDRNQQLADYRGTQHTAMALAAPGVAGRLGADYMGSRMGAGLGAMMGARFGGLPGAAIGSTIGAIGGLLGTDHFLGRGVQNVVDDMNPLARMTRHSAQIRGMTSDFVVGGPNMSMTGRGLNPSASTHLARSLHDVAGQSGFQRETGGMFSSQDLMRITQVSGQQGLLDMAQRPDQIAGQVKNIAKALKSFMQIASEPDVTEALKQLGQMRNMGLSLGESMQAVQQAKGFARASGTSVRGVMEMGGLPGAMIFQQQGLSAGLGMQVGMGSLGMARQAVAGGSYTAQQLGMLGGTQGIAQRNMEMSASMLKQPLLAAAMTGYGAGGTFGLNADAMSSLARGQVGIQQMAGMGVNNLMDAVRKGGVGALASFQMEQSELQDQMGRALGPAGIKMMGFQQIMQTQKLLGLKGPGGAFAAAKAMGMTDDQARQNVLEMNSPEFFQNQQRQILMTRQDERAMARERRAATAPTLMDVGEQKFETVRAARGAMRNIGTGMGDLLEGMSNMLSSSPQEAAARRAGQTYRRTPRELLAQSPMEERLVSSMRYSDIMGAGGFATGAGRDTAIFHTPGGRGIGRSETVADIRDAFFGGNSDDLRQLRAAQGGLRGALGGGPMETVARVLTAGNVFDTGDVVREKGRDMQRGTEGTMRGLGADVTSRKGAMGRLTKTLGKDKANAARQAFERIIADKARSKARLVGQNEQLSGSDYDEALKAAAAAAGVDPKQLNLSDLQEVGIKGAKILAGAEGEGSFRGEEFTGEGGFRGRVNQLTEEQTQQGLKLLGDEGGVLSKFGLGGDATRREKAMAEMFGTDEDARVGMLASLQAAAGQDEGAARRLQQLQSEMDPGEFEELSERASNMLGRAGENKDMFARAGKRYGNAMSMSDMVKEAQEGQKSYLGRKAGLRAGKGLEAFADKSVLDKLSNDPIRDLMKTGGAGLKGGMKDLAEKYGKAGNQKARDAILDEATALALQTGAVSEGEAVGGPADAAADRKASLQQQTVGSTAADSAANFPNAVSTFSEASRALLYAAQRLGTADVATNE